jgi:hypothetical protein
MSYPYYGTAPLERRRAQKLADARARGAAYGVTSVLRLGQSSRKPAPPRVRRDLGSPKGDAVALHRDAERLFG